MKKPINIILLLSALLLNVIAFAQEKEIDIDITTSEKDAWYTGPWVWVAGAAIFILLLVAILRPGNNRTDV